MLKVHWLTVKYRFVHWFFQWKIDEEGDIAFVICNRFAFVKYKEHTICRVKGVSEFKSAPKWVGGL